jgi:hypothetical protein
MALLNRRFAVVVLLACSLFACRAQAQVAAGEYQIKAAFLHHFAKIVDWPPETLPPNAPLVIGLIGDDPFGRAIDDVISNDATANGHRIVVRRLHWNDVISGCQIVFISSSEIAHLDQVLGALRGWSVLTVGDIDHFAQRGGMIELRAAGNRVKFDINTTAASSARLRISSKLLQLARTVYTPAGTAEPQ